MNADVFVNGRTGVAVAALLAAVGFGLTGAQTPTMAAFSGMSELAKLAAAGGVDALQQDLDARSPGARAPGALTQTKERRVASLKDEFEPKERVLGGGRTRPSPGAAPAEAFEPMALKSPDLFTPVDPTGPTSVVNLGDVTPYTPVTRPNPIPGGGTPPIIVGGGGGGGGGSGGGGGGGGTTPGGGGDTPVGGAVPEPATWLTLILGFFAIGFGLRGGAVLRTPNRIDGRTVQ